MRSTPGRSKHRLAWLPAAILLLALAAPAAYGAGEAGIEGYWRGYQDDGNWSFVYQFLETAPGQYKGIIHVYRGDEKMEEVPIKSVEFAGGKVKLLVELNNIRIEGPVDFEERVIQATYFYQDGSTADMALSWVEPETLKGLEARSAPGGGEYVYEYSRPGETKDGWKVSSLDKEGLDRKRIEDLVMAAVGGEFGQLHSLVMARNGRLVLEEYFYGHDAGSVHRQASVTKSVSSLLIGIAIDRGEIAGVDENIMAFFPGYQGRAAAGWEEVTLEHILTMTAGVGWDEDDLSGFYESDDHFGIVFEQPVEGTPGAEFEYVSPNVDLLAGVIKEATGMHADVYAEEHLFGPLGFGDYDWEYGRWEGYPLMDGSLHLLPRDMAKLGQMVLDGGRWRGNQVVSAEYISASTAAHVDVDGPEEYGYLWWRTEAPFEGSLVQGIYASGWGSQFIFVVPEYDLVVVTTGGNHDNGMNFAPAKMFPEYILPALK